MAAIGTIVSISTLFTLSAIFRGFAFTYAWKWFIIPTFHVPPIDIATAIGFALIVGFFKPDKAEKDKPKQNIPELWIEAIARTVFEPVIFLFLGWIVSRFVS